MTREILVKTVTPQDWKVLAENAHLVVFEEKWDKELERIDFALVMVKKETNELIAYTTCQIIAPKTIYLQYGGAFPKYKGTAISFLAFQEMLKDLKNQYSKIVTLVENTNYPMLKFYMKEYFTITGIRYFGSHIFLENQYEFAS